MAVLETEGALATEPIVAVTPTAVKQVKRQQEKTGKVSWYLRLGVRGGGCSGLS